MPRVFRSFVNHEIYYISQFIAHHKQHLVQTCIRLSRGTLSERMCNGVSYLTFGDRDIRTYRSRRKRHIRISGYRNEKNGRNRNCFRILRCKTKVRVFTNLSRTLLAWRRSFSRTALVPGSSQSSSALEQRLFKDTASQFESKFLKVECIYKHFRVI